MSKAKSFKPVIDKKSRILILGTMPGVESLEQHKYYANPRNQFWKIIYSIFKLKAPLEYSRRIAFLKSKGIALWDVLASCDRKGSSDSNINNEKANDFNKLYKQYPNITKVAFNGSKAEKLYKKLVKPNPDLKIRFVTLPSTSPANTKSDKYKLKEWERILVR